MKLSYSQARDVAEAMQDGKKVSPELKRALIAYVMDMRGIGPRAPHTIMPDRGSDPRRAVPGGNPYKAGSKSYSNK
jgi:hypothetical protein